MKVPVVEFNTYLLLLLLCASPGWGCRSAAKDKKTGKKEYYVLRLHIEVNSDGTDKNVPVTIGRNAPFAVNVNKLPFLEELNIRRAEVVDDGLGGFAMKIEYNRQGTWLLEQYTVANKGKHVAVFAEFGEIRWLAAPRIDHRITDGVFTFTPDATREEAERLVLGVNNTVKRERSRTSLKDPL